jgi:hydrogenase expression/formation protein HypC
MCLALPAKIHQLEGILAWVTVGQTQMKVSVIMTPEVNVGDWVLVHAGFAIRQVSREDALQTWDLINSVESRAQEAAG